MKNQERLLEDFVAHQPALSTLNSRHLPEYKQRGTWRWCVEIAEKP